MSGLTVPEFSKQTKPFYSEAAQGISLSENPTEKDVELYKVTLKEQQYKDFDAAVHSTAENVSNFIRSPDAMHFSKTSSDIIMDNYNAAPAEQKTAANLVLIKSLTHDEKAAAIHNPNGDITIAIPHFLDEHTQRETIEVIKTLSDNDLMSNEAKQAAAFIAAHETAHGISDIAKHAQIDKEIAAAIDGFVKDDQHFISEVKSKATDSFNRYITDNNVKAENFILGKLITPETAELEKEILADSFGVLKTQQEYYRSNKDAIENSDKPLVTPMLDKLFTMRHGFSSADRGHDTSDEVALLIDKLSTKEANEQLLNASDEQLIVTAYDLMAKTFPYEFNQANDQTLKEVIGDKIMETEAKISFPDTYLKGHEQPLFDFKLNKDFIDKNTAETQQRIQEDNEPSLLSRIGF